ncbi:MAG: YidH family protein [Planctomycetota bacterium]
MGDDGREDTPKELACERTRLAQERTFAAWLRTGLSLLVGGAALAELVPSSPASWVFDAVAALLIFTAGVLFAVGHASHRKAVRRMRASGLEEPPWVLALVTTALLVATFLAFVRAVGAL